MKVFVINPPFKSRFCRPQRWPVVNITKATLRYPDWLAYLTAVLEQEGFDTRLFDFIAENRDIGDLQNLIRSERPDMVVMDASTPSIFYDVECARACKSAFDTKVVFVGPHATVYPEDVLRMADGAIDCIARGEYEYTVLELAKFIANGNTDYAKILGLSYIDKAKQIYHNSKRPLIEDLDNLPFPAWHHLDIRKYAHVFIDNPYLNIIGGRGCPFQCTFCQWPQVMFSRKLRCRSAKNVVDEMEYNLQRYKIREVLFEDDTFTADRERTRDICHQILDRRLHIKWSCNARCDISDLDLLKLMKAAGCQTLVVGIESGAQEILDRVKKGITIEKMRNFVNLAKKAKLKLHCCYVLGLPGETEETMAQTIRFAREIDSLSIQVASAIPQVGTEFYDWAMEKGYLKIKTWNDYTKDGELIPLLEYPNLSSKTVKKYVNKLFLKYYYRPKMVYRQLLECNSPEKFFMRVKAIFNLTKYILR